MTGAGSPLDALPILGAQGAAFLALLLGASALHKASDRSRSLGVVRGLAGMPERLAGAGLGLAVGAELAAAALLLAPSTRSAGALLAACLWSVYFGLLLRAIRLNRRDLDCGCSFGSAHRPLGAFQLVRNAVLVGVSAGVWAVSRGGAAPAMAGSQLLAACAMLALYGALDQVMALEPLRAGVTQ